MMTMMTLFATAQAARRSGGQKEGREGSLGVPDTVGLGVTLQSVSLTVYGPTLRAYPLNATGKG